MERENALSLLKKFCELYFIRRDVDAACQLLSKNIMWFGTGAGEDVHNIEEARCSMQNEMAENPSPYKIKYICEECRPIGPDASTAFVKLKMSSPDITLDCRLSVTASREDGAWKVDTIHMSVPTALQNEDQYYPASFSAEKEEALRDSLLNKTINGATIGGYMEPGFPYYFASERMLSYLGYSSEAEFIEDIGGLIINSMHPEDGRQLEEDIMRAIAESGGYSVEYRMLRKDGSYLWVQDHGRKVTAADGKEAIVSVIFDITKQKEAELQLQKTALQMQNIINAIPGGVAIYKVSDKFETVYFSDGVPGLSGYTVEEYRELVKGDAADMTHPDDREMVVREMLYVCSHGTVADFEFRKIHRDGHIVWVHLQGVKIGEEDGCPLIQCVFHNISKLKEDEMLNEHLIDSISGGVATFQYVDGKIKTLRCSKGLLEMTGYNDEDYEAALKYNAFDIIYKDDVANFTKSLVKAMTTDGVLRYSYRITRKDGHVAGIHLNAKTIGRQNGHPVWYAVFMGMSDESRLYREIANDAINGIYVVNKLNYEILYMNHQMEQSLEERGYSLRVGDKCHEALRLCDKPCEECAVFSPDEGVPREIYFAHLGKYFSVVSRSIEWEGLPAYVVYLSDISEEKKANTEIRRIYNNIPGAVFQCRFDEGWSVISANDGLYKFLGYTREEFSAMGNQMAPVTHPDDLAVMGGSVVSQLESGKKLLENEHRLICKGGVVKWISVKAQLLVNDAGEKFFYCIFVDITRQKTNEEKRIASENNLAIAMEHAKMYYWEFEFETGRVYVNAAVQKAFGVPAILEHYPASYFDEEFVAEEDVPKYQECVKRLLSGEGYTETDVRVRTLQHGYSWMRVRFTATAVENGAVTRAVCTAEEIAEYKELESRFTTVLAQNGIVTWLYDISRRVMIQNYNSKANCGIERDEIENVPESLIESGICHPDHADKLRDFYKRLYDGEKQISAVIRLWCEPKHCYEWKRCTYTVIPDRDGQPTYALGSAVDVSEQVEAKQKYENAIKYRYRSLGDNVLLAGHCNITQNKIIEICDKTGAALLKRFGSDREKFFQGIGALIPDSEQRRAFYGIALRDSVTANFGLGITQRTAVCEINVAASGSNLRWVSVCIDAAEEPLSKELIGFLTVTDITDTKMQEQVLESVIECDYDYVGHLNLRSGAITLYKSGSYAAEPTRYLYGTPSTFSDVSEETAKLSVVPGEREDYLRRLDIRNVEEELRWKDFYEFTFHMREQDGRMRTKRLRIVAQDRAAGIAVISRTDVTEMISQQESQKAALLESLSIAEKANHSKSDFLSAMSHDIRTPMNAIIGMTELAVSDESNAKQVHESLQIIKSSSSVLLSIINDILDMSRIESGKMVLADETFSIAKQCHIAVDAIRGLSSRKNQQLKICSNIRHNLCCGDVARIHRALDNILSNAVKFTPEGGSIKCSLTELPMQNQNFALYRFEIADTGIGIPQEEQPHIFEPFYRVESSMTSRTEGTGLGLSIAKSIVDCMGGTISFQSEAGAGTTFVIELPLRLAEADHNEQPPSVEPEVAESALFGLRVLLCEDHPVNQKVAERILERAGVIVTVAENGQRGCELFSESPTGAFDVILMDVQMPVMNGYEATQSIRASAHPQARTIPILAMTANAFAEDVQKSLSAGMNDHLAKPIDPKRLYAALARYAQTLPENKIIDEL
ncbi:MAG: PAS domain-containing protein [Cloacibacillus sp.]